MVNVYFYKCWINPNIYYDNLTYFLDLAVAKSLQSTRTVTDADADDDDAADVLTTTGYTY